MMWFFRHFWIFISYHIFLLNQVEGAVAIPPSNSAPLPLFCPSVCPSVCPSIGLLTIFSGFCTFADKSLGRNGIELEMQMFPDDLPLANIDADGYCCHFMRSSVRPWAWVCVLHTKRLEEMAYNLACWCIQMAYTQHSWMLMDIVVGPSVRLFVYGIFSKVRVGAKEGGSHYWEMAVAITCGYRGYLLPLLAAHSSFKIWCSSSLYRLISQTLTVKLFLGECQRTSLMRRQHWFRQWLGATSHFLSHYWPSSIFTTWCL